MITFPINDIAELGMAVFLMVIGLIVMCAAIEKLDEARTRARLCGNRYIAQYQTARVGYSLAMVWGFTMTVVTGYNIAMALA